MTEKAQNPGTTPPACDGCGGSGVIGFFRGVSRFVMDWDDCPDCHGTGLAQQPPAARTDDSVASGSAGGTTTDNAPTAHHAEQPGRTDDH